jgi:hypothetical protein
MRPRPSGGNWTDAGHQDAGHGKRWRSHLKLSYVRAVNEATRRSSDRPLLLLDIDGVISVFGFDPTAPPPGRLRLVDGLPHYLSDVAAGAIRGLANDFELVWCSGWEERADEHLPVALGVPAGLPHLVFGRPRGAPAQTPARHWKLEAIDAFAGPNRALAWVDDAFDASCRAWATARPGPTRLLRTDPAVGITPGDADRLRDWAFGLDG